MFPENHGRWTVGCLHAFQCSGDPRTAGLGTHVGSEQSASADWFRQNQSMSRDKRILSEHRCNTTWHAPNHCHSQSQLFCLTCMSADKGAASSFQCRCSSSHKLYEVFFCLVLHCVRHLHQRQGSLRHGTHCFTIAQGMHCCNLPKNIRIINEASEKIDSLHRRNISTSFPFCIDFDNCGIITYTHSDACTSFCRWLGWYVHPGHGSAEGSRTNLCTTATTAHR